ncbi:hypothetical protein MMC07_000786 [Pseudocyphellaria aurata]|nr:hypothetical protein [Pseudocyphellaria aurata]
MVVRVGDASPSPPPQPPIPLTPGPRASKFFTLFASALTKTLSTVSLSKFGACFPTVAARAPEILSAVHAQIVAGVHARVTAEFEDICKEREVVAGLNELERLVAEARARRQRGELGSDSSGRTVDAPHTLPPTTLYLAHLAPYLAATQTQLVAQIADTQTENEALAGRIAAQREQVDVLLEGLERRLRDLDGANEVLGACGVGEGGDGGGGGGGGGG